MAAGEELPSGDGAALGCPCPAAQRPQPGAEARGRNGATGVPVRPAGLSGTPLGRVLRADYTSRRAPRAVAARGMPGARQRRGLHDLPLPPARQRPLVSRWAGLSFSRRSERCPHHPISTVSGAAVANERRWRAGPRRGRR